MGPADSQDLSDVRQQRLAAMLDILSGNTDPGDFGKTTLNEQDTATKDQLTSLHNEIASRLTQSRDTQTAANENAKLAEDIRNHNMLDARSREELTQKLNAAKEKGDISPREAQNIDASIKMVGNGQLSYQEASSRLPGPLRLEFTRQLGEQFPDFSSPDFKVKAAALHDFATGTQGQQLVKMQNASNHLTLLEQAGAALDNGDLQGINKFANFLGVQSGSTPQATYNALVPIVANEVMNATVKGGGGEQERQNTAATLSASLSGPQRSAAIGGIRGILGAQASNLKNQYQQATGRDDFDKKYPGFVGSATATPSMGSGPLGNTVPGPQGAGPQGLPAARQGAWGKATVVNP